MLPTLLITGAAGYIGTELIKRLSENDLVGEIIALDIRPVAQEDRIVGVT